jgi:alkylation response protein AidB-like acyl-CoA dehydrogenase
MPGPRDATPRRRAIMARAGALARVLAERMGDNDQGSVFPEESFRDPHESGYLRLALPVEHGGEGAGVFEMVLAREILGRADASTALVCGMNLSLMGRVLDSKAWPESVIAELCARLVRDGGTINNRVTEADLGGISRGGLPAMTAEEVEGGFPLSGRKIFVTGAPALRYLATATVPPPSSRSETGELAHALVEGGAPGLSIVDTWSGALGPRGCGNDDVVYDRVFVPERLVVERLPIGRHYRPQGGSAWALPLERYFRDARGGLFQPPQDDLAPMLLGRTALAAERERMAG